MDTVIAKVMTFAQKLVDADRASLFLVDHKSNELYARIFDMGDGVGDGQTPAAAKEIRFPLGTGIAGQVAVTGKVIMGVCVSLLLKLSRNYNNFFVFFFWNFHPGFKHTRRLFR